MLAHSVFVFLSEYHPHRQLLVRPASLLRFPSPTAHLYAGMHACPIATIACYVFDFASCRFSHAHALTATRMQTFRASRSLRVPGRARTGERARSLFTPARGLTSFQLVRIAGARALLGLGQVQGDQHARARRDQPGARRCA
eukprot:6209332-Pleurochrysis_carterae.AAC.2